MASITKSMVVSAADKKMIDVEIPEWGGKAKLRVMSGSERDRFEGEFQGGAAAFGQGPGHAGVDLGADAQG